VSIQREHEARLLVMLGEVEHTVEEGASKGGSKIPGPKGVEPSGEPEGDLAEDLERAQKLLSMKDEANEILREQHDYYQELSAELRAKLDDSSDLQIVAQEEASEAKLEAEDLQLQLTKMQNELDTRGRGRSVTIGGLQALQEEDGEIFSDCEATVTELMEENDQKIGEFVKQNLMDLQSLWVNIGLPVNEQQRKRRQMISPVVKLCESEQSKNKQHELELKEELEELKAMMTTQDEGFQAALQEKLSTGGITGGEMALWESVEFLRSEGHSLLSGQLNDLKQLITATAPSQGKKIKWRTRWVSDPIDREILDGTLRPTKSAFENLATRREEVMNMSEEAKRAIDEYTVDLREQWEALNTPQEEQDDITTKAQRGGFNAVHAIERVLEEAKANVRLKLRSLRVKLTELWVEVKKSGKEQDAFLMEVDTLKPIDGLTMIKAEMERVTGVINSMKDIIKMIAVRESLSAKISEFEAAAKNPDRFKGSSAKLLKEEKERKLFARKNDRICVELITKIEDWEREMRMPFMYRGMHYKQVLQAEQSQIKSSGGTNLARSSSKSDINSTNSPRLTSSTKTPATAPRPASAVSRKETAARRSSGMDNTERRKQLEEWRVGNEAKKKEEAKKKQGGGRPETAPSRRLSGIPSGGSSKIPAK